MRFSSDSGSPGLTTGVGAGVVPAVVGVGVGVTRGLRDGLGVTVPVEVEALGVGEADPPPVAGPRLDGRASSCFTWATATPPPTPMTTAAVTQIAACLT